MNPFGKRGWPSSTIASKKDMKGEKMFARKLLSGWRLLWVLPLTTLLFQFGRIVPAMAEVRANEFNIQTAVPVSDLVFRPPNPCNQNIRITGELVIQAHIVITPNAYTLFSSSRLPVGTIATLHLDATGITGIGQTDGTVYQGTQGTSQPFNASLDSMNFDTTFNLIPQDLGDSSLSPACSLQPTFQVQIYYLEMGVSGISASLIN